MIHVVNQALPYRNFCCFHLLLLHFGSRLALPFQHMKLGSDFMPSYSLVASFAFEYFILKVKLIRSYLLSNPKWQHNQVRTMPHEVEVVRTSSILIKHEEIVTCIYFFVGMNDECIHPLFHSLFSLEDVFHFSEFLQYICW